MDRFKKDTQLLFKLEQIFKEHKELEYELLTLYKPELIRHSKSIELDKKQKEILKEQRIKIDTSRLREPNYLADIAKQQQMNSVESLKVTAVGAEAQEIREAGDMRRDGLKTKAAYIAEESQGVDIYLYMKHVLPVVYAKFKA